MPKLGFVVREMCIDADLVVGIVSRLGDELEAAAAETMLPERATAHHTLDVLIVRVRLSPGDGGGGLAARPRGER